MCVRVCIVSIACVCLCPVKLDDLEVCDLVGDLPTSVLPTSTYIGFYRKSTFFLFQLKVPIMFKVSSQATARINE